MAGRKFRFTSDDIPKSATSSRICYLGVLSFMISIYFIRIYNIDSFYGSIIAGLALAIPIVLLEILELKTYKRPSTGLDFNQTKKRDLNRILIKLLGLYVTIGLVVLLYWLFPEYNAPYYTNFWHFAKCLIWIILLGAIPYFFILDKYEIEPYDAYWKVGRIILGKWKDITSEGLKNHFLGWLIKAFFFPLMYVGLFGNIGILKNTPFSLAISNFNSFFDYSYTYIYTIDLVFVTIGYLMTFRIFDSHIRTAEPTFLGWYVALQCYKPFWDALNGNYFAYNDDNFSWGQWLYTNPEVYKFWGILILVLISIYAWASIMFGIRFSNLTNRGILTNGPYRIMKHPAYISKNISWWLIAIPFVSQSGFSIGIRNCLLLLFVNFLYYMRARTEERHLSKDPVYKQYALAMNEVSIFKGLYKLMPYLKYDPKRYENT